MRGAVLTAFLRLLRFDIADLGGGDAAEKALEWMFDEGAESFAPATHPFMDRRYMWMDAERERHRIFDLQVTCPYSLPTHPIPGSNLTNGAVRALARAVGCDPARREGRTPVQLSNEHAAQKRFFVFLHVGCRLAAVPHKAFVEKVTATPSLLDLNGESGIQPLLSTLASIYDQRAKLSEHAPEDRFWRSRRFGNAIQTDEDEPPSTEFPMRWPHVRSLLDSLSKATAAPGNGVAELLALDNAKWIHRHAAKDEGVDGVGSVWGTVSARERYFYVQYFGGVTEPSMVDATQPIGAGAARGFSYVLSKHDAFHGKWLSARYTDKDMCRVVTAARDDASSFATVYSEALAWLDAEIAKAPEEDGVRSALQRTRASATAARFFESVRDGGTPPSQEWEEGLCDGRKAVQGWEGDDHYGYKHYYAKGKLLSLRRQELGELARPEAVFMYSLKWDASSKLWRVCTRWVPVQDSGTQGVQGKKRQRK